jgi:hypothetical protein
MRAILHLSIFCLSLILFSCTKESKHTGYVDKNEILVEDLTEVEGNARTYNFDFDILKEPHKACYYEPTSISVALNSIPEEMRDAIHLPNINYLPFTPGTSNANIVTFWNKFNTLIFQVQISYFENPTEYNAGNQDFFIISATQLADNPFIDDLISEDDPIDQWRIDFNVDGDEGPEEVVIYRELELTPDLPLFYKNSFSHWSTMYPYYSYDQSSNKIIHTSTGSKMYYAWHDGVIFQIGYKFDDETIDIESVIRKIILGS